MFWIRQAIPSATPQPDPDARRLTTEEAESLYLFMQGYTQREIAALQGFQGYPNDALTARAASIREKLVGESTP